MDELHRCEEGFDDFLGSKNNFTNFNSSRGRASTVPNLHCRLFSIAILPPSLYPYFYSSPSPSALFLRLLQVHFHHCLPSFLPPTSTLVVVGIVRPLSLMIAGSSPSSSAVLPAIHIHIATSCHRCHPRYLISITGEKEIERRAQGDVQSGTKQLRIET
ncbi:unnamed protein product [Victoria cruziana]